MALSGDGGDEIFGGYEKYLMRGRRALGMPRLSAFVRRSLESCRGGRAASGVSIERTLAGRESLRYSYSRYGDFPVFRKDLAQLFSRDFRGGCPDRRVL